jgi:single-strand DNA-binding protein
MTDINTTIMVGRLTQDVEVKTTSTGTTLGLISLAVNRSRKQGDEWIEEVSYFDWKIFNLKEGLQNLLVKGRALTLSGYAKQDRWQNDQGQNRNKVGFVAEKVKVHFGGEDLKSQTTKKPAEKTQDFEDDIPF